MRGEWGGPCVPARGNIFIFGTPHRDVDLPDKLAQQHRKVNPPNTCTRAHTRVRVLSFVIRLTLLAMFYGLYNMAQGANIPTHKPKHYNVSTIILVNRIKKAPPDRRGKVRGRKSKYLE